MPETLNILVVDDDLFWRDRAVAHVKSAVGKSAEIAKFYDSLPPRIHTSSTPEEAIDIILEYHPVLSLLDINLDRSDQKNRDGIELILIPSRAAGYRGKVLCSSSNPQYEHFALDSGADAFIVKGKLLANPEIITSLILKHITPSR